MNSVTGNSNVRFISNFSGRGSPYWGAFSIHKSEAEQRSGMAGLGTMAVNELGLSKRITNALERQGIADLYSLVDLIVNDWQGFLWLQSIGEGGRKEIMEMMIGYGITEKRVSF